MQFFAEDCKMHLAKSAAIGKIIPMKELYPIDLVVRELGSQAELARLLEVGDTTLSYWRRVRRELPAEMAIKLEKVTNGRFTRYFTRPDLFVV